MPYPPLMMRSVAFLIPTLLIIVVGCGESGGAAQKGGGDSPTASAPGEGARGRGARVVPVATAPVERRELVRRITVTGPIEPIRVIAVSSQMPGTIRTLTVEEGASVGRGRTIATLDAREVSAQLDRARASLSNATSRHDRTKLLLERKLATDAEFENVMAELTVARSDVRLWETRRGFTRIVAPSSGVVTARLVEVGGTVAANQKIVEIADVSTLVVRVRVSDLDVVHLNVGDRLSLSVDAFPGRQIEGRIRRIFPAADNSRLVPVEVAIGPAPAGVRLKPGFLARVTLPLGKGVVSLTVPSAAIAVSNEGPYVYVVRGDSLERRSVRTGSNTDGWVQVIDGLAEGENVVVGGQTTLRPGARVHPVPVGDTSGKETGR